MKKLSKLFEDKELGPPTEKLSECLFLPVHDWMEFSCRPPAEMKIDSKRIVKELVFAEYDSDEIEETRPKMADYYKQVNYFDLSSENYYFEQHVKTFVRQVFDKENLIPKKVDMFAVTCNDLILHFVSLFNYFSHQIKPSMYPSMSGHCSFNTLSKGGYSALIHTACFASIVSNQHQPLTL